MRFTIEIDDDDRGDVADHPWTANIYRIDPETGEGGDTLGVGFGNTPGQAVAHALGYTTPAMLRDRIAWTQPNPEEA